MEKAKVYFTKKITPESVVELYKHLGITLKGNVGLKVHSGEKGNQNYLRPTFVKPIYDHLNATIIECNTAYEGARNESKKHLKLLEEHEWTKYFKVDLMDEVGPDIELKTEKFNVISSDFVGKDLASYDSILVLSHFKGHPMGGFGGALKQLSIGFASCEGKTWIHSAGTNKDQYKLWNNLPEQDAFLESMADAASMVHNHFKGNIAYINCLVNLSVDCDCCSVAEDPCVKDIGLLASLDPIAIDQASIDLVYNSGDEGVPHFKERVERQNGRHILDAADKLGFGTREYELISID